MFSFSQQQQQPQQQPQPQQSPYGNNQSPFGNNQTPFGNSQAQYANSGASLGGNTAAAQSQSTLNPFGQSLQAGSQSAASMPHSFSTPSLQQFTNGGNINSTTTAKQNDPLYTSVGPPSPLRPSTPKSTRQGFAASLGGSGDRRYVPSHLSRLTQQKKRGSSISAGTGSAAATSSSSPPSTGNSFGGASFGTPKPVQRHRSQARGLKGITLHRTQEDGPPIMSIYDSPRSMWSEMVDEPASIAGSEASNQAPTRSLTSSKTMSNLSTGASTADAATSVVIFGFPASLTQYVLDVFRSYGSIATHQASGSDEGAHAGNVMVGGNWLRITYADAAGAARAVDANGMLLGGSYMIGCVYARGQPGENSIQVRNGDDAMEVDQTPPGKQQRASIMGSRQGLIAGGGGMSRSQTTPALAALDASPQTPLRGQKGLETPQTSVRGAKRVQLLESDDIFSKPVASGAGGSGGWLGWISGAGSGGSGSGGTRSSQHTTGGQSGGSSGAAPGSTALTSRMARAVLETIFGF